MAGAYCQYCDQRCFVLRKLPDGSQLHMATCPKGMEHDRAVTGHDHITARKRAESETIGDFMRRRARAGGAG